MKPETAHYVKLFNRLEAAVRKHMDACGSPELNMGTPEADAQLHASYRAVMKDAAKGPHS
jgi:hypothetical protein